MWHRGHLNAGGHNAANRAADENTGDDVLVADNTFIQQGNNHGDQHADSRQHVAAYSSFRLGQALDAKNKEDGGDEVN